MVSIQKRVLLIVSSMVGLVVIGGLYFMRKKSVVMPASLGRYGTGITAYHLVDKNRKEELSPRSEDYRELMVYVWYPIDKNSKGELYPYLPQIMPYVKRLVSQETQVPVERLGYLDKIKTHSIYDGQIATAHQIHYPVVFFSHGFVMSAAQMYTSLLEELASHGFIVVAIDHTYENLATVFPDGRIITNEDVRADDQVCIADESQKKEMVARGLDGWVADIQFVCNELEKINKHDPHGILTSRCDMTRIGIFGHSNGGAAAAQVCRRDSRFKAGIDIDGQIYGRDAEQTINKPFMLLLGQAFLGGLYPTDEQLAQAHITKADCDKLVKEQLHIAENLFKNLEHDAYFVLLKGAGHASFGDLGLLLSLTTPNMLEPTQVIEITRKLIVSFFDAYLYNDDKKVISAVVASYPDVVDMNIKL